VHGGPLNWGSDGKIYHHSIYLYTTDFTVNAFNTYANTYETFFASPDHGYISPYYANLTTSPVTNFTLSERSISVYPNPTTAEINVVLPFANQKFVIEIYSLLGQQLFTTSEQTVINISNFKNGVYILSVKQNGQIFKTKLVKQ
jgi:hypothetical protein